MSSTRVGGKLINLTCRRVTSQLENDVLAEFKNIGSKATNVKEAKECSIIKKKID